MLSKAEVHLTFRTMEGFSRCGRYRDKCTRVSVHDVT